MILVWTFGILFVIFVGVAFLSRATCYSRWERSGMPASWGVIQGCIVEVEKGRWLPEDRVREIEIPRGK